MAITVVFARLPPPGPPPDPSRGETYDGRAPEREPFGRRLALGLPRAALAPPRIVLRLVPPAARGLVKLFRPASDGGPRRARRGLAVTGSAEIPAIGLRLWSRDLLGPDSTTASCKILTGGPSFQEVRFDLDPNRDREVGLSAYLVGRNRTDDFFYGIVPEVPASASDAELRRRVHVAAAEIGAALRLRPGGAAGRWRFSLGLGGALRRYYAGQESPSVMLEELPATATQFVATELWVERLGRWDPTRRRPVLDVALGARPARGLGDDESRFAVFQARAALGVPLGEGTSVLLRARASALESWGDDAVGFWEVPEVGGDIHRGFADGRFRGPTTAVASLDVRWPIRLRLDGFAFVEYGGAFGERFDDFGPQRMRPGVGTGVRLYRTHGILLRTFVAWGIGDGPRVGLSFDAGR